MKESNSKPSKSSNKSGFSIQKHPLHSNNHNQKSVKPKPRKKLNRTVGVVLIIVAGVLMGLGLYILVLSLTPKVTKKSADQVKAEQQKPANPEVNMLYIPTAGITSEIDEGDIRILDQGKVWHRFPKEGDPTKGGNTILTGHSFVWGYTPKQIKKDSIFYHLGDAKVGDSVTVHWNKKDYQYKVTEVKTVKPNETSIEAPSKEPKLTIYTCTLGGSADGRVVVIAKPSS